MSNFVETFNGARCKSYCWSQSHSDLEIRIKLTRNVRYEDVNLDISSKRIKVELQNSIDIKKPSSTKILLSSETDNNHLKENINKNDNYECDKTNHRSESICLMSGTFENSIVTESIYWLIDSEDSSIVIYLDKKEDRWWKQLLLDEQVSELGPKNYSIQMEHLDDGTRMIVDKLIFEQKNKLHL